LTSVKTRKKTEFGDFQTPSRLAEEVCRVVAARRVRPSAIVEPTCGKGAFLVAALKQFPSARTALGLETNADHLGISRERLHDPRPVTLLQGNFFTFDWPVALRKMEEPILVIGNPPWVTSAGLGWFDSSNLPPKSNFQQHRGLDALTGKSNFDIAEWMVVRMLECLSGRVATVAMLLKTSVARRVLLHAWKSRIALADAAMLTFDAQEYFGAAVRACLLILDLSPAGSSAQCRVSDLRHPEGKARVVAYEKGVLVADKAAFDRWHHLMLDAPQRGFYRWRSGVKHDCAPVMELRRTASGLTNGLSDTVDLEENCLYPLLKGTDVARGVAAHPRILLLVTQTEPGQDTTYLASTAPRTWAYLAKHAKALDGRRSSIYRKRPRFSIFGVGRYTFAPWKVAISGLHKKFHFVAVGSQGGKPILVDDTCYHISCKYADEARLLASVLNGPVAAEFYGAFVFWDAKRPVTADLLNRLDLAALVDEMGQKRRLLELRPDFARGAAAVKALF
jgi:hypothetical protein